MESSDRADLEREVRALRQRLQQADAAWSDKERVDRTLFDPTSPFRAIFEHGSTGMTIVDVEGAGRILDVNAAMTEILGYERDRLRRMSFTDYSMPDEGQTNLHYYREAIEGKRDSYEMTKRLRRVDGAIVTVNLTGAAIRDAAGHTRYVVGMLERRPAVPGADPREILPICCYCKSTRDDAGRWKPVEALFQDRLGMRLTHAICPECLRREHPGA